MTSDWWGSLTSHFSRITSHFVFIALVIEAIFLRHNPRPYSLRTLEPGQIRCVCCDNSAQNAAGDHVADKMIIHRYKADEHRTQGTVPMTRPCGVAINHTVRN